MNFSTATVLSVVLLTCTSQTLAVTFDWIAVGNPGNAADTTGFGAVDYDYRISKYEVTNAQYADFLNAVAASDPNRLYNVSLGFDSQGGISRTGSSGSYSYAVKSDVIGEGPGGTDYAYADKPVVGVSFFDAMRFVNWLENGQPAGAQGPGTTEDGVYNISNGVSEVRDPNATFFIPSEDEWYKAAYYNPSGIYFDYPMSTSARPNNNLPSADTGNSANFNDRGLRTTGSFQYPMTDVGAYALSASPYGAYDQGGNAAEWVDGIVNSTSRALRGGSWEDPVELMHATFEISLFATTRSRFIGFRVAGIPDTNPGLPGDFNSDDVVNGIDLLEWQRGESPDSLSASDLANWKSQYSIGTDSRARAMQTPEPSTALLLVAAIAAAHLGHRRRLEGISKRTHYP